MKRKLLFVLWMGLLVVTGGIVSNAQQATAGISLLLIDETKTFLSTMRVAGFVGALRAMATFQVDVRLVDVSSGFDDPLDGLEADPGVEPYSIVVIVSRGIDDGSAPYIWILSQAPDGLPLAAALGAVRQTASAVFEGIAVPVGVYDDLFPALLREVYVLRGWMP